MKNKKGFTLIELLIVVAIIAILAAIAVPNFLEAQTRAKVSRVKSDVRTVITALESYAVDNNKYPILRLYFENQGQFTQYDRGGIYNVVDLSTPIAYISSTNIRDPFVPPTPTDQFGDIQEAAEGEVSATVNYINIDVYRRLQGWSKTPASYALLSYGPDYVRGPIPGVTTPYLSTYGLDPTINNRNWFVEAQYDPTNGTLSGGDILRFQGRDYN